ncbi:unnamed protein product [Diatraea saccharalis]|uniref:Uncharacterized protein n=1 Tax=Diatraea saccharalis TaxID=40085 RepID=A0A9N9RAB6_9NEOP|nr:unnamed protein product [Diatraea saccharalis]
MFSFIQIMCIAIFFWLYIYIIIGGSWALSMIIGWWHLTLNAAILASFSDRNSYYRMLKEFSDIDMTLGSNVGCHVNIKIILFTFLVMLYRYVLDALLCFTGSFICPPMAVSLYLKYNYMCFYATMTINFFIFYCAYCRLKILNEIVKKSFYNVTECLNLYKTINDTVDKIMKIFLYLVCIKSLV